MLAFVNDRIWVETCLCETPNRQSTKAGQIHNAENSP
jgi:hypothetical protein